MSILEIIGQRDNVKIIFHICSYTLFEDSFGSLQTCMGSFYVCHVEIIYGNTKMLIMVIFTILFTMYIKPWWWWCRPHPVREHAQDLRPPLRARPASSPTHQAAQPPPWGPSTNPRPLV